MLVQTDIPMPKAHSVNAPDVPDLAEAADPPVASLRQDGTELPMPRRQAHRPPGVLHRAVSVQVCASGRWLLQRRAAAKPLFAGCWANTCCTHPMPGEAPTDTARRRLEEELGLAVTDLLYAGTFIYRAADSESGLVEHERDDVYVTVADIHAAVADPVEISETVALPFSQALALVSSESGAPWAAEVLKLARRALRQQP